MICVVYAVQKFLVQDIIYGWGEGDLLVMGKSLSIQHEYSGKTMFIT